MSNSKNQKETVYVLNFGCSANQAIAEGLKGKLYRNHYRLTDSMEEADTIVVNTCVVKQNTEHRMKSLLLSLTPHKNVIITGCLPVVMRDWVSENIPSAKVLFPEMAHEIASLMQDHPVDELRITDSDTWSQLYLKGRAQFNPIISIIEISRGCLGNCTYCIVRKAKGKLRSRAKSNILKEVNRALVDGTKEIWLTSQDTGAYGRDLTPKLYLTDLLLSVNELNHEFFVRLGMMTPFMAHQFSDTLIKILNHPNIYSFLHLPIQSGSDRILALMRRKEKQITFLELIEQLRAKVPELILSTDIIVGFPGESEQDYEETRNMIEKIRFNIVNISKYTDRPDTEASRMTDKVPTKIKSRRSRELTKITHKITKTMLKEWIGWEGKVLIDEYGKKPNQFMGRNTSYLPILFENAEVALGDFINARIVDSKAIYLVGEVLNKIK